MKLRNAVFAIAAGAATLAYAPVTLLAQGPPPPPPGYQGGPPPGYAPQPWETPPSEYQEVGRQGFRDGIEGARKDFENHRRPDVNNRDEFRHPRYEGRDRKSYRDSFRRGYQVGVQNIMNGGRR